MNHSKQVSSGAKSRVLRLTDYEIQLVLGALSSNRKRAEESNLDMLANDTSKVIAKIRKQAK